MYAMFLWFVFACLAFPAVDADTPANCSYEDIKGTWIFRVGQLNNDKTVKCTSVGAVKSVLKVNLLFPDVAVDQFGNNGFWTIIYNQGFEVVVHGRKYFAFSKYTGTMQNATSYCDETMPGWTHDVIGREWGCFVGKKLAPSVEPKRTIKKFDSAFNPDQLYQHNQGFVAKINNVQKSWKAVHYKEYEKITLSDMTRRAGGLKSRIHGKPAVAPSSDELRKLAAALPDNFDWRNRDGVDFVPDVRDQKACGSCYAFASVEMNEARLRIATNNTVRLTLSPQDVVDCSEYSQGCDGGFPYLIGGKYAEDFGLVEESCSPYSSQTSKCTTKPSCQRHYSTEYRYVGGYYGACNEESMLLALHRNGPIAVSFEVYSDFSHYKHGIYQHTSLVDKLNRFNPFDLTNHVVLVVGYGQDISGCNEEKMMLALYKNGPMAVAFEVYNDFYAYKGGIYQHTSLVDRFNPFQLTDHAVLVVGYGIEAATGLKYWIVENSWGKDWGEKGYFRILRGVDECAIESVAVESFPIF